MTAAEALQTDKPLCPYCFTDKTPAPLTDVRYLAAGWLVQAGRCQNCGRLLWMPKKTEVHSHTHGSRV